jgi:Ca-activated chloride channel family protein
MEVRKMSLKRPLGIMLLCMLLGMGIPLSNAVSEEATDRTLSPYFFVKSGDPDLDQLPLKSTTAHVTISGVIADVVVTQVYKNEGRRALEAVYVFPASTRAAVYGMKMRIGKRTIEAKIEERRAARKKYERAKQAGKRASLLEQHRPNVFQMSVANILPSDVIQVELRYTELLVPTEAVYEFVYPTVVGPRYTESAESEVPRSGRWTQNPYLHQGKGPPYTFDMKVNLAAGLPLRDIKSPTHRVKVAFQGPDAAEVTLDPSERGGGNRDFILKYRLAGRRIETGMLLYEGEKAKFFLLMLQPPKRVTEQQIPPREYLFVVDVSGSMHGFPLKISKRLLKDLIKNLRPTDKFNVLMFSGGSRVMSEQSVPATPENVRRAAAMIDLERGGGATRLLKALKRALALPRAEGCSRTIVIATDGYVAVEAQTFDLIRSHLDKANVFAFGIGSSVNRHLIQGMARVGMGEPFVVITPEAAIEKARQFRKLIQSPVLTDTKIDYGAFQAYDVEPLTIPDVLADRPIIVFGKWRGSAKGTINIKGIAGERVFNRKVNVAEATPMGRLSGLKYLWARHRIAVLSDYNRLKKDDERVKEVTRLGLTYNLLTAYTSFVAIDTRVINKDGKPVTVKQPLPLPKGVSDLAVGQGGRSFSRVGSAPMGVVPSSRPSVRMLRKQQFECKSEEEDKASDRAGDPATDETSLLRLGSVRVSGPHSEEVVRRFLKKQMPFIQACVTPTLAVRPAVKKELKFQLMIDPAGHVKRIQMESGLGGPGTLWRCIMEKLKSLQFPVLHGGSASMVRLTFVVQG